LAKDWELPHASMPGVDQPDSIRPRKRIEFTGFTEVEGHGPGLVQQGEYARGNPGEVQIDVGHVRPDQRVSLSEAIVDVDTEGRGDGPGVG